MASPEKMALLCEPCKKASACRHLECLDGDGAIPIRTMRSQWYWLLTQGPLNIPCETTVASCHQNAVFRHLALLQSHLVTKWGTNGIVALSVAPCQ